MVVWARVPLERVLRTPSGWQAVDKLATDISGFRKEAAGGRHEREVAYKHEYFEY